jgi:hypothetical protein
MIIILRKLFCRLIERVWTRYNTNSKQCYLFGSMETDSLSCGLDYKLSTRKHCQYM